MMGWLNKCWGEVGVTNSFERTRISCTTADWSMIDPTLLGCTISSISELMDTFDNKNKEMSSQAAFNSLLVHFEHDENRQNPAFILKNLLILDVLTEERVFLNKISHYHNSRLIYMEGNSLDITSSVKDLIGSYYTYIKEKAKLYLEQNSALLNKSQRSDFIQKSAPSKILQEVNICFKVQRLILDVSDKFAHGNKSPGLIQQLFCSLLKTYLFCYSIAAISIRSFLNRLEQLNRFELQYFQKMALFFNKQYTCNFLLFIERNKMIESFKCIKYNEIIVIDQKIFRSIDTHLILLNQNSYEDPQNTLVHELPQNVVPIKLMVDDTYRRGYKTEQQVQSKEVRQRRIPLKNNELLSTDENTPFQKYQNFYSEMFVIESEQETPILTEKKLHSDSSMRDREILYANMNQTSLNSHIQSGYLAKFSKEKWDSFKNVYST